MIALHRLSIERRTMANRYWFCKKNPRAGLSGEKVGSRGIRRKLNLPYQPLRRQLDVNIDMA